LNIKKIMTYDVGNPGPGIRQAHKCGKVKLVKGIPTPTVLITGFPLAIEIRTHNISGDRH
jgi:hypothetical protein